MISTAPAATTPSSDITSRSTPRRRALGKLSRAAIASSSATAMLSSPTALGDDTGSAPTAATQRLPSDGHHTGPTISRQDRRRRPRVWAARTAQLTRPEHAGQQQAALLAACRTAPREEVAEQQRDREAQHHGGRGRDREAPPLHGERRRAHAGRVSSVARLAASLPEMVPRAVRAARCQAVSPRRRTGTSRRAARSSYEMPNVSATTAPSGPTWKVASSV